MILLVKGVSLKAEEQRTKLSYISIKISQTSDFYILVMTNSEVTFILCLEEFLVILI